MLSFRKAVTETVWLAIHPSQESSKRLEYFKRLLSTTYGGDVDNFLDNVGNLDYIDVNAWREELYDSTDSDTDTDYREEGIRFAQVRPVIRNMILEDMAEEHEHRKGTIYNTVEAVLSEYYGATAIDKDKDAIYTWVTPLVKLLNSEINNRQKTKQEVKYEENSVEYSKIKPEKRDALLDKMLKLVKTTNKSYPKIVLEVLYEEFGGETVVAAPDAIIDDWVKILEDKYWDYYDMQTWREPSASTYNFSAAGPDETIVYGAQSPIKTAANLTEVEAWFTFMKAQGIERIVSLLEEKQIEDGIRKLKINVLEKEQEVFGADNVLWVPVKDFAFVSKQQWEKIFEFLKESDKAQKKTLIHCSAGMGRTGQILSLWLHYGRNISAKDAVELISHSKGTHRNAFEAIYTDDINKFNKLIGLPETKSKAKKPLPLPKNNKQQMYENLFPPEPKVEQKPLSMRQDTRDRWRRIHEKK